MQETQIADGSSSAALNELIETTKDGESGFRNAAKDSTDIILKELFLRLSHERGLFARELQPFVEHKTEKVDTATVTGAMHRGWITVRAAVSTRSNLAVLEECERGEAYAARQYDAALQSNSLGNATAQVKSQYDRIVRAHQEVKSRRDKLAAKY